MYWETHRIIDMIDSREADQVTQWLRKRPQIQIVTRDGSLSYAKAIREALPLAIQINDRFHLIHNLTKAGKNYLLAKLPATIKITEDKCTQENHTTQQIPKTKPISDPSERKRENKEQTISMVKKEHFNGKSLSRIARETGLTRNTVRKYVRIEERYTHGSKGVDQGSILDRSEEKILLMRSAGKTGRAIYESLREEGYTGSESSVRRYLRRWKNAERSASPKCRKIQRKDLISMLYKTKRTIESKDRDLIEQFIQTQPWIENLFYVVEEFKGILAQKNVAGLNAWMKKANQLKISEIQSFIRGIERDRQAVDLAIGTDYSNGLAEGLINKVKVEKRIMYGRGSTELLRQKLLIKYIM